MVLFISLVLLAATTKRRAVAEPGRPKAAVVLTFDERSQLQAWAHNPPADAPSLARRSLIVLRCAEGYTNRDVAEYLGVSEKTVAKWRRRFLARRLDGLRDDPRPGVPRSITDEQEDALIFSTLVGRPDGRAWTRASMAKECHTSESSVGRFWKEHGLRPRRVNIVSLSADPAFVGKIRDVVGLYLQPPEGAFVLCVDETEPIPAARRATPMVLGPEMAGDRSSDDQPNATTRLHAALGAAGEQVNADPALAKATERERDLQFRRFLEGIDKAVPEDLDLHVVVDYGSTKMTEALREWLLGHLRFEFHTTPTYGWWMTVAEWWFTELATHGLARSPAELAASINEWIPRWNEYPRPFDWHKSADEIVHMLYP